MGRIYYIMGKSATGKDTVYKELLVRCPELQTIVPYTTRPIREGEVHGVEYYFTTNEELDRMKESGKVIELRTYHTVMGAWNYFTADDGQFDLESDVDYLMIGTLESYEMMCRYFGESALIPVYIEIPDGIRLHRATVREDAQKKPNYREVCRRYLADEEDFSEKKLNRLNINKRFINLELSECLNEIMEEIRRRDDYGRR